MADEPSLQIAFVGLAATNAVALVGTFAALEAQNRSATAEAERQSRSLEHDAQMRLRDHLVATRTEVVAEARRVITNAQLVIHAVDLRLSAIHPAIKKRQGLVDALSEAQAAVDQLRAVDLNVAMFRTRLSEPKVVEALEHHESVYNQALRAALAFEDKLKDVAEGRIVNLDTDTQVLNDLIGCWNRAREELKEKQLAFAAALESFAVAAEPHT